MPGQAGEVLVSVLEVMDEAEELGVADEDEYIELMQHIKAECDERIAAFRQRVEDETKELICIGCNGSGEGHYDGTRCSDCGGCGVERPELDEDDFIEPEREPFEDPFYEPA
jgi:hypothetical protein